MLSPYIAFALIAPALVGRLTVCHHEAPGAESACQCCEATASGRSPGETYMNEGIEAAMWVSVAALGMFATVSPFIVWYFQ